MLEKTEREVAIPIMRAMPMGYSVELGETTDQLNRTSRLASASASCAMSSP